MIYTHKSVCVYVYIYINMFVNTWKYVQNKVKSSITLVNSLIQLFPKQHKMNLRKQYIITP